MNLSISERLALNSVLPETGNITTLKIVRQLREDLSFSEDEHDKFEFTEEEGTIRWSSDSEDTGKDIDIGEKATDIIVDSLKRLDGQQKLVEAHMGIWEKFCEAP